MKVLHFIKNFGKEHVWKTLTVLCAGLFTPLNPICGILLILIVIRIWMNVDWSLIQKQPRE